MNTTRLTATILTVIGIGLTIADFFTTGDKLGFAAIPFLVAAGVAWVRSDREQENHWERNAFEAGRESVRSLR